MIFKNYFGKWTREMLVHGVAPYHLVTGYSNLRFNYNTISIVNRLLLEGYSSSLPTLGIGRICQSRDASRPARGHFSSEHSAIVDINIVGSFFSFLACLSLLDAGSSHPISVGKNGAIRS